MKQPYIYQQNYDSEPVYVGFAENEDELYDRVDRNFIFECSTFCVLEEDLYVDMRDDLDEEDVKELDEYFKLDELKHRDFRIPGMDNVFICALFDYPNKIVHLWKVETGYLSNNCPYKYEWSLGELPYDEHFFIKISTYVKNIANGLIRCCYCGKWIPVKESHSFAPAGCSCDDCYEKGKADENEFYSYGD